MLCKYTSFGGSVARILAGVLLLWGLFVGCEGPGTETAEPGMLLGDIPVDPRIGTGGLGPTFPGAVMPMGMVQVSPDSGTSGWARTAGFQWGGGRFLGMGHTHLSGTGIGDGLDLLVAPASPGRPFSSSGGVGVWTYRPEAFWCEPGYVALRIHETGVLVEAAAGRRMAVHRFTFPRGARAMLAWDLRHAHETDRVEAGGFRLIRAREAEGWRVTRGWSPEHRIAFSLLFSHPGKKMGGGGDGDPLKGVLDFGFIDGPLCVSVGVSSRTPDQARENRQAEETGCDFDAVRGRSAAQWRELLSRVEVEGGTAQARRAFYTALYHSLVHPSLHGDVDGAYAVPTGRAGSGNPERLTNLSLWDTFRSQFPLLATLYPERYALIVRSLLDSAREQGRLPVWELCGAETDTMIGNHALAVLADTLVRAPGLLDPQEALHWARVTQEGSRGGLDLYREVGYIPWDECPESVSRTLEFAYGDWCVSRIAAAAGEVGLAQTYEARSARYRHLFDAGTGFFRGRDRQGVWHTPFDPYSCNHRQDDYTEATAWQYLWFVPHDPGGLAGLMGGKETLLARLHTFFTDDTPVRGPDPSVDISGTIGQYAHGNEPCHLVPFLFHQMGDPGAGQIWLDAIQSRLYRDDPEGLCGNDDCGQLSAWHVWVGLGLQPGCPGDPRLAVCVPNFRKATLHLAGSRDLVIRCTGEGRHWVRAWCNGRVVERSSPFVWVHELRDGGEIVLENP